MISKVKIYNDGSHYIGLPIIHLEEEKSETMQNSCNGIPGFSSVSTDDLPFDLSDSWERYIAAKEVFEKYYSYSMSLSKKERLDFLHSKLDGFFSSFDMATKFIQGNLNRKYRNFVYRRLRCLRKLNLTDFNYFCTFTYDDKKLSEADFRKKFSYFIQNRATRDGWSYIGVWERGSETERLHFHALINMPEGTLPGKNVKKRKWSSKVKRLVTVIENDYILERFGVNDFSPIDLEDANEYNDILCYLLKYIEKSGERLVYSRGLSTFLEAYIDEEDDVLCLNYSPCLRYTLYDDFRVFNPDGTLIGINNETLLSALKKRMS